MKNLIIISMVLLALTSCTKTPEEAQKEREVAYYLNEDFTLIEAKEDIAGGDNGNAYKVRTWVIERLTAEYPDTVQRAEIISKVSTDLSEDCNCGNSNFIITNELWYGKPVGSKLHFDFIRKDRFFRIKKADVVEVQKPIEEVKVDNTGEDKMQIELKILELEREAMLLKEKLKTY